MTLICVKCDCVMVEIIKPMSTRPLGWICPKCKCKVRVKE